MSATWTATVDEVVWTATDFPTVTFETFIRTGTTAGGTFDGVHNDIGGRSATNTHPISAITGLQAALDAAGESGGTAANIYPFDFSFAGNAPLVDALYETMAAGSTVLLHGQTDSAENGAYLADGSDTLLFDPSFPLTHSDPILIVIRIYPFFEFADIPSGPPAEPFFAMLPAGTDFSAESVPLDSNAVAVSANQVGIYSWDFVHLDVGTNNVQLLAEAVDAMPNAAHLPAYVPGDNAFAAPPGTFLVEDDGGTIRLLATSYEGHTLNPLQVFIQMGDPEDSRSGFWRAPDPVEVGGVCTRPTSIQSAEFQDVTHNTMVKLADSDTYGQCLAVVRESGTGENRDAQYFIYLVPKNVVSDGETLVATPSKLGSGAGRVSLDINRTSLTVDSEAETADFGVSHVRLLTTTDDASVVLPDDNPWPVLIDGGAGAGTMAVTTTGGALIPVVAEGEWWACYCYGGDDWTAVSLGASAGTGDVVGPASSTDGRPALFDGTTGKLLKVGTTNAADGLVKLDGSATIPDILIPSSIARDSEVTAAADAAEAAAIAASLPIASIEGAPPFTFDDWVPLWNHYGSGSATAGIGSSATNSNSAVRYLPFRVLKSIGVTGLGIEVPTGNAGGSAVLRLGIHSATSGRPGAVVAQATGTAVAGAKEVTWTEVTLTPGDYFAAIAFQSLDTAGVNPTIRVTATTNASAPRTTIPASANQAATFGATVAGALAATPTVSVVTGITPLLWMKVHTP